MTKRVKFILIALVFLLSGMMYFHFSGKPSDEVCGLLVVNAMKDPAYYDMAIKLGCSRRHIVKLLNGTL